MVAVGVVPTTFQGEKWTRRFLSLDPTLSSPPCARARHRGCRYWRRRSRSFRHPSRRDPVDGIPNHRVAAPVADTSIRCSATNAGFCKPAARCSALSCCTARHFKQHRPGWHVRSWHGQRHHTVTRHGLSIVPRFKPDDGQSAEKQYSANLATGSAPWFLTYW
jgi:hypothetical protein